MSLGMLPEECWLMSYLFAFCFLICLLCCEFNSVAGKSALLSLSLLLKNSSLSLRNSWVIWEGVGSFD